MPYIKSQQRVIIGKFVEFHIILLNRVFCFMWLEISWALCLYYFGFLPHFGCTQHEYYLLPNNTSSYKSRNTIM